MKRCAALLTAALVAAMLFSGCGVTQGGGNAAEESPGPEEDSVTLQDVLLETDVYDGQFVRISSELKIYANNLDRKSFRTYLSTGSGPLDSDMDLDLEVYYDEMTDWKTWGTMSADYQIIKVAGTITASEYQAIGCGIKASEITIIK
jgi:hypothetical protein